MTTSINHYIPQNYSPIEHEYVEPRADDYFIYWLFRYRCIICKRPATEINEIVPRARSKKSILDWKNRVTLCHEHHLGDTGFHHNGVTEKKIFDMRIARMDYLKSVGREKYI
jgi:5-methylcytosine-specific restriction endonuclease McrA